jgi:site-specific DNA-cytosine methylase
LESEDNSEHHFKQDVREILNDGWDLMIAHPPCQYLTGAGLHWNKRVAGRAEKTEQALEFVYCLLNAPINKICLENPVGIISKRMRPPDQYIQPWQFGHPESKKTGFWLKGLPKLVPTNILQPTKYQANGKPQWDNQTPTGQNKLGPSPSRWKDRSRTYEGIALAMVEQWT